ECDVCVLADLCRARAAARVDELPIPRARPEPVRLTIPLFVVQDDDGRILFRRDAGALMRSMLHLPHGNSSLLPFSSSAFVPERRLGSFRHTITHRRIEFEVCTASPTGEVRESAGEMLWLFPAELEEHGHPSYVEKALRIWAEAQNGEAANIRNANQREERGER
ncbi:MAG: hypothetical protein WBX15_19055, partial [Thermoanaerobaculia bacterium]